MSQKDHTYTNKRIEEFKKALFLVAISALAVMACILYGLKEQDSKVNDSQFQMALWRAQVQAHKNQVDIPTDIYKALQLFTKEGWMSARKAGMASNQLLTNLTYYPDYGGFLTPQNYELFIQTGRDN